MSQAIGPTSKEIQKFILNHLIALTPENILLKDQSVKSRMNASLLCFSVQYKQEIIEKGIEISLLNALLDNHPMLDFDFYDGAKTVPLMIQWGILPVNASANTVTNEHSLKLVSIIAKILFDMFNQVIEKKQRKEAREIRTNEISADLGTLFRFIFGAALVIGLANLGIQIAKIL